MGFHLCTVFWYIMNTILRTCIQNDAIAIKSNDADKTNMYRSEKTCNLIQSILEVRRSTQSYNVIIDISIRGYVIVLSVCLHGMMQEVALTQANCLLFRVSRVCVCVEGSNTSISNIRKQVYWSREISPLCP